MIANKDYTFSIIRLIAILLIVFCHTFEVIGSQGYGKHYGIIGNYMSVGVQIFLLLSGYLYGMRDKLFEYKTRFCFEVQNFKKILFEYYVYLIFVAIPIYLILKPDVISFKSIFATLTFSGFWVGIHHFWFIPYILLCYLLIPILTELKSYIYIYI